MQYDPPPGFALAKIQPPRPRAALVERSGLEQALGEALMQQRLTLLVAPAGYGKTAALTRQIGRLPAGCALAWLSADEDDGLQRFLACLTTALEPHDLPWRVAPEALATLALAERGLRDVAGELVNALAASEVERGLIVIDDAHRIADPRVFELLQRMLDRWPAHWALALAGRVEPPLALSRLRAAGELAEFRQQALRFSEAEVGALLRAAGGDADPREAHELLQRTQGWAAGLRLSLSTHASHPTRRPGDAAQRHVFDYLAAEVLDGMPAPLRDFLLRCAVLPELSAERCAEVSGLTPPEAQRLLEEVEARGLFVSVLDVQVLTLRLHDLFRAFLEDRLRRERSEGLPELLRRAAASEPDVARAVGYLVRAGAWDAALQVLLERGQPLLGAGGGPGLAQLLSLFPPSQSALGVARPDLQFLRGLVAFQQLDFDLLLAEMETAALGYRQAGRERDAALARAHVCLAWLHVDRIAEARAELVTLRAQALDPAARAFVCYTSAWAAYADACTDEVAPQVEAMLDALEQVDDLRAWERCTFYTPFVGLPGMAALIERLARGALRVGGDAPSQLHAGAMHGRAWLALAAGRLAEARQWLARADEDNRWLGRPRLVDTENRMAHGLLHAVCGDPQASHAAARDNAHDMAHHSPQTHRLAHQYEGLAIQARACWLLQDDDGLREAAGALARVANPFEWRAAPRTRAFSQALLACAEQRLDEAERLLAPLAAETERFAFFPATQARWLLADVQQRLGRLDDAAASLRPWLQAARGSGEVGGALLAGAAVLQRLAAQPWGHRLAEAELALLRRLAVLSEEACQGAVLAQPEAPRREAAASVGEPVAGGEGIQADGLMERLTERELEVLARMAAGDSNKLIARAFDLSPHTVKRHVANILGKLDAQTRGQAAARWRERALQ